MSPVLYRWATLARGRYYGFSQKGNPFLWNEANHKWIFVIFALKMLQKSHNHKHNPRNDHKRQEDKTDQEKYQNSSDAWIDDKAEIKIDNFITGFSLEWWKLSFFEKEISQNEENAESTAREDIADYMEDT
jgi:hypothetical protein